MFVGTRKHAAMQATPDHAPLILYRGEAVGAGEALARIGTSTLMLIGVVLGLLAAAALSRETPKRGAEASTLLSPPESARAHVRPGVFSLEGFTEQENRNDR